MNSIDRAAVPVDVYRARIGQHLDALTAGHDPWHHLLSIERLARAARAEWWAARRPDEQEQKSR